MSKRCTGCGKLFPLKEKHWGKPQSRKGRLSPARFTPTCRKCKNERARIWRASQPGSKLRAIQRRNKEQRIARIGVDGERKRLKRINIAKKYGLTLEQYEELWNDQGGCCAICQRPAESQYFAVLAVDHNHTTGEVRGLLCTQCNTLLGMAGDSRHILKRAIRYLREYGDT